jgi:tetratricopeptide (TPR) repeat protein
MKSPINTLEIDRLALQLAKDPHSKVFMPLADEYVKAGMWQEAAAVLEDGLKHYPGFITAMVALGRAYDQMGQTTKAKAILEEAVKLSPENLRAHRTLVKIYAAQGETESARRSCAVILAVNPQDEEALSIQARLGKASVLKTSAASVTASGRTVTGSAVPGPMAATPVAPIEDRAAPVNASQDPLSAATALMESTLEKIPRPQAPTVEPDETPTTKRSTTEPAHWVVTQLETWLRSIQTRRRDHAQNSRDTSASS